MKKRKTFIIIAGVTGVAVLVLLAIQLWGPSFSSAATLTEQQARETVLHRYAGEITEIKQDENRYIVDLMLDTGRYEIQINAENGDVLSIVHLEPNDAIDENVALTREQVESIVQNHATGTIASIDKVTDEALGEYYRAVLRTDEQETVVTVDPFSGDILSSSTSVINNPPSNDGTTEPKSPPAVEQPPRLLTETEAANIALQHIPGELDDVDLEQSHGVGYYLVEIELEDDREATVQIHAITGEIMSVTWDD